MDHGMESSSSGNGGGGSSDGSVGSAFATDDGGRYQLDEDGRFVAVSEAFLGLTGYGREELRGKHVLTLFPTRDAKRYTVAVGQLETQEGLASTDLAIALQTADGESLPCSLTLTSPANGDGWQSIVTVRSVADDDTDERDRGPDLTAALAETAAGVLVLDDDRTIRWANETVAEYLGCDRDGLVGTDQRTLFEDRLAEPDAFAAATRESTGTNSEGVCHIDGGDDLTERVLAYRRHSITAGPLAGGCVELYHERPERAGRPERSDRAQVSPDAIVDALPDLVYAFDDRGRLVHWNESVTDVTGYDDSELDGSFVLDFVPSADTERISRAVEQVFQGTADRLESALVTADGEERPYEFSAAPVVDEDGELGGFAGVGRDISAHRARERRLKAHTDRLERVARLTAVIQDVDQAILGAETHQEIETAVCERLTDADLFQFAWIGQQRSTDSTIVERATAGQPVEGFDTVTVRSDESPAGQGPVGRACRSREIQVCQDVHEARDVNPHLEHAASSGVRSLVAIPLVYEDTLYGVLSVYSRDAGGWTEPEQRALTTLGETIGHAIDNSLTSQAQQTEQLTEATVQLSLSSGVLSQLTDIDGCTATFEGAMSDDDGSMLYYLTVHGLSADRIRERAAEIGELDDVHVVTAHDDACLITYRVDGPTIYDTVSGYGATVTEATINESVVSLTLEVPAISDVSALLDALRTRFGGVELLSEQDTDQSVQTDDQFRAELLERLTDRQHAALELAYHTGYFAWPRETTGEELAESLDVSPPTFHKHLRIAERKLVTALLDGLLPDRMR